MNTDQLALFDLIAQINADTPDSGLVAYTEPDPSICPHRWGIGKNGDGWTLEHDTESPYFGKWVDSNPNCRRPGY